MKYYIIGMLTILVALTYYYNKDYSLYLEPSEVIPHEVGGMFYIKTGGDTKPKLIALKGRDKMSDDELNAAQAVLLSASQIQIEAMEGDVGNEGEISVTAWADGVRIN